MADQTRLASLERHFSQINATLLHIYGISVQHSWQHHRFVLPFPGFLEKHDWTSHQFLRSLALEIRRRSCFSWLERGSSGFSKESLTLTLESCPVLSRTSLADCCFGRPNAHEGVLRSRTRKEKTNIERQPTHSVPIPPSMKHPKCQNHGATLDSEPNTSWAKAVTLT